MSLLYPHRVLYVLVSLSLLISATGPLFQPPCSLEDPHSHHSEDDDFSGAHSDSRDDNPCPSDHDTSSPQSDQCLHYVSQCCPIHAIHSNKMVTDVGQSSSVTMDKIPLLHSLNFFSLKTSSPTLDNSCTSSQYPLHSNLTDRQIILCIFLI